MPTTILFNRRSLRAPLSKEDMGTLLLHEVCKEIPDQKKAEGLIKSGADLNLIDQHGFSALMWAVTKCHDALADAIIENSTLPEEETG